MIRSYHHRIKSIASTERHILHNRHNACLLAIDLLSREQVDCTQLDLVVLLLVSGSRSLLVRFSHLNLLLAQVETNNLGCSKYIGLTTCTLHLVYDLCNSG